MRFGNIQFLYYLIPLAITAIAIFFIHKANENFYISNNITTLRKNFALDRKFFRTFFLIGATALIIVALASPRFGVALEKGKRKGRDIYLLLDVSASMNAKDLSPSRLEITKQTVYDFLSIMHQDRIGVIVFAGDAFVLCPLTTDYNAITMFVESIDTDMTSAYGTNLGQALAIGRESFPEGSEGFKTMVVFTDGEDFQGEISGAVEKCVNDGIIIYTVGVGSNAGAPIPVLDDKGNTLSYKKNENGETVITKLNSEILKSLASKGKGQFFHINNNLAIKDLAKKINSLSKKNLETKGFIKLKDRYYIPLSVGVVFLLMFLILL